MALNFGSDDQSKTQNARASAQVKRWAREHLVDEDATLVVSELACTEPGCPPIETMIAVLDVGRRHTWKIHKRVAEVVEDDVRSLRHGAPHIDPHVD